MKVLAIIPARGGSKGIKNKNLVKIGGIPLLGRTISSVKKCKLINSIVVSTDSVKIAETAKEYGVKVIDRPKELAGDNASSESAVTHCCEVLAKEGLVYDLIVLVQNTSPFHSYSDMTKLIKVISSGDYNSAITAVATHKYFWSESTNGFEMAWQKRGPRQSRKPLYQEAGSLYGVRYCDFVLDGNLFKEPVGIVEIPWWRGFEIDESEDIEAAEVIYENYKNRLDNN